MKQKVSLTFTALLTLSMLTACRGAQCPIECSSCGTDPVTGDLTLVICAGYSPDRLDTSVKEALLSDLVLRDTNMQKVLFAGKVNLERIQLVNCGIESLAPDVFTDAHGLATLDISVNKLTHITASTFMSAPGLEELILDNNSINTVDDAAFAGMTQLQKLSLARNNLTSLTVEMFFGLRSLVQLDLSYNYLETINSAALSKITAVESVNLSGNRLVTLDSRQFNVLTSLLTLKLSDNLIASIATDAFLGTVLTDVDLSGNRLSSVPTQSLEAVKNTLTSMNTAANDISGLDPNELNGYTLNLLDLSNNSLRRVDVLAFDGAVINITHLENNDLGVLPIGLESFLTGSSEVYLTGNPWVCDCDTLWLMQSVRDNPRKYPSVNGVSPACSVASHYPGLDLQTAAAVLENECLTTSTGPTTQAVICPYLCSFCETDPATGNIVKVICSDISPRQVPNTVTEMILSQHDIRGGELGPVVFEGKYLLESVTLKTFGIRSITSDVFSNNRALRELHLEGNTLATLSPAMFTSVPALQELRLINNSISSIPDDVFASLGDLHTLNLASNHLTELSDNAFRRLSNLQFLDISNNKLRTVNSQALLAVPSLTALLLTGNNIASLSTGELGSLRNLQLLVASENDITSVASDTFAGTGIIDLDISGNNLRFVSPFAQDITSTLQTLKLSRNNIQTISSNAFRGTNMELLDISDNSLVYFNAVDIGNPNINVTNLANNSIEMFSSDSTTFLNQASFVYLSSNPWLCDCDTMWLMQTVRDSPIKYQLQNGAAPTCSSSSKNADMELQKAAALLENDCLTTSTLPTIPTVTCPYLCSVCETHPVTGSVVKVECDGVFPGDVPDTVREMLLTNYQPRRGELSNIFFQGKTFLERVELMNFGITSIASDAFSDSPNLSVLHLRGNTLSTLSEGMFSSVPSLTELHIVDSGISAIPDDTFTNLEHLETLNLSTNDLTGLPDNVFRGLPSLTSLDMSHNKLTSVCPLAIQAAPSLTFLDVSSNIIGHLREGDFTGLRNLDVLWLANNDLALVDARVFTGTALSNIDFSDNSLTSIPQSIHDIASTLKTLNINNNTIETLAAGSLELLRLEVLELSNNSLRTIESLAFSNSVVNVMNIANNNLEALPSDMLPFLEQSSSVFLSDNPWLCDCDHLKFLAIANDNVDRFHLSTRPAFCSSPAEYASVDLLSAMARLEGECMTTTHTTTTTTTPGECPAQCTLCERDQVTDDIVKVECEGIDLMSLPNTVEDVSLSKFNVPGGELRLDYLAGKFNLISLKLDNYIFKTFAKDVFRDNTRLNSVFITNSGLTDLTDDVFENLTSLKQLALFGNNITEVRVRALNGLGELRFLELSRNAISSFESRAVADSPLLMGLSLSRNKLTSVDDNMFSVLPSLQYLMLSDNLISYISDSAFVNTSLLQLSLANNRLTVYPTNSLLPVRQTLKHLELPGNMIVALGSSICSGMTLEKMDLARNAIATIDDAAFQDCSVQGTSLEDNALSTVLPSFMDFITRGMGTYLTGNPWACDCDTMWFADFIATLDVLQYKHFHYSADPACASPTEYVNVSLVDVAGILAASCLTTTTSSSRTEDWTTETPSSSVTTTTSINTSTAFSPDTTTETTTVVNTTNVTLNVTLLSTDTSIPEAKETTTAINGSDTTTASRTAHTTLTPASLTTALTAGTTTTAATAEETTTPSTETTSSSADQQKVTDKPKPSNAGVIAGSATGAVAVILAVGAVFWRFKIIGKFAKLCPKSTPSTTAPSAPGQPPTTTQPPAQKSSAPNNTSENNHGSRRRKPSRSDIDDKSADENKKESSMPEVEV